MERLKRDVILIRLIEALRERGSWCGETHVQKATYFLQEMVGTETGFEFILYKHGPFSFELRDELAAMRADGFVSLRVQDPSYGPSIVPEPAASMLRERFPNTLKKHEERIVFVADKLGNKSVVQLERLATAFYISKEMESEADTSKRAQRVHELKPHIPLDEALEAVKTVDTWRAAGLLPKS
jgi:uncharacterized protein YwgA